MKLEAVIKELREAKEKGYHGFIEVTIPGQNGTEFIVNKPESIENKIKYYKKTYDDNGVHKHCSDINPFFIYLWCKGNMTVSKTVALSSILRRYANISD